MSTLSQFVGGSPIKSIQRGVIGIGGGNTSATATISSVNTSKAMVNFLGCIHSSTSTTATQIQHVAGVLTRVDLTNGTTVTATRGNGSLSSTSTVSYEVIEFV